MSARPSYPRRHVPLASTSPRSPSKRSSARHRRKPDPHLVQARPPARQLVGAAAPGGHVDGPHPGTWRALVPVATPAAPAPATSGAVAPELEPERSLLARAGQLRAGEGAARQHDPPRPAGRGVAQPAGDLDREITARRVSGDPSLECEWQRRRSSP